MLFFGLPMLVVPACSFVDYSHAPLHPAFIFDNDAELFESSLTFKLCSFTLSS